MKLERLKEKLLKQIHHFEKEANVRRETLDEKIYRLQDEMKEEDLEIETISAGLFIGSAVWSILLAFEGYDDFWWFLLISCIGVAVSLTVYLYKNSKRMKQHDEILYSIENLRDEQRYIESELFVKLMANLNEMHEKQFQLLEARSMYYASLPSLMNAAAWIKNKALEDFNKIPRDSSHPLAEKTFKVNVYLGKVKLKGDTSHYFELNQLELYTFEDCIAFALALHRELNRLFFYELDQFGCNIQYEEIDRSDDVLDFMLSAKNMNYVNNGHF